MATKKKAIKRKVQSAKRKVQSHVQNTERKVQSQVHSAERRVQSAERKLENATIDAQIAALEEQIAMLQAQSAERKAQSAESKVADQNHSALCALRSALPKIGPNPLPAPVLVVTSVGTNEIVVSWNAVNSASGYTIELADNPAFADYSLFGVPVSETTQTISGLAPNTTYYIRAMTVGSGANGNSAYSNVESIKTLNDGTGGMDDDIVGDLQSWLDDLQTLNQRFLSLLPDYNGEVLSSAQRKRLLGSGVRRYGYIDKVSDTAEAYPQFWPAFATNATSAITRDTGESTGAEKLKEMVREIEVLRNLLIAFRFGTRVVEDMLMTVGDEAFRLANVYYRTVRDAARSNIPEAAEVFQMLESFWKRRRRMSDEPTEMELLRDTKALLRGSKDGTISVSNESDSVIKGKKVLVDHTFPKPRGGIKVVESAEVE